MHPLNQPVESLPGIGGVTGKTLRARGLGTVGAVLLHLPRRYDDERRLVPLGELVPGERQVTHGRVASIVARGGRRKKMLELRLEPLPGDAPGRFGFLRLVWFHAPPGLTTRYARGDELRVVGKVELHRGAVTMAHPTVSVPDASAGAIEPRYPDVGGIKPKTLAKAIAAAASRGARSYPDHIPAWLREEAAISAVGDALLALHGPPRDLDAKAFEAYCELRSPGHLRLALEEFFLLELAVALRKSEYAGLPAKVLSPATDHLERAEAALPFTLTAAQARCVAEIGADLERRRPMRRLLQGDVGAGKTAVAMLAAARAVASGAQVAFLAPTELLAEQHTRSFRPFAEALGLRLSLCLGGGVGDYEGLEAGEVDVAIGTHALLTGKARFRELGLAIVDEQHRFGVAQRLALVAKGAGAVPHLLVMTATPIPRSLALVLYGDLDVSLLDELPPGRLPPVTRAYPEPRRSEALRQLERALEAGGRAYVVCPAIDGDESLRGVLPTRHELAVRFGDERVLAVHGRVGSEDRGRIMKAFADGVATVLVATTVVEVGVDVPEANVIIIEQAERFGLAQLHQLRGRVGRGGQRSACLLVHGELTDDAEARLAAMCELADGFRIAERDLQIRGPGQVFGRRQSGNAGFRFGDLSRDLPLLERARALATRTLSVDPTLEREDARWARRAIDALADEPVREEAG